MKELNYMEIGERIRSRRELLHMTRDELAEYLDLSTKFCADIELGIRGMSLATLNKLCGVLHLSADYVLFGEKPSSEPDAIGDILKTLPKEKQKYAEELLCVFIKSLND